MEDLAVFGRSLNWLFTKRIVPDFEPVTGTVGKITCDLVENAFLDVENFVVDGSLDKGEEVSFSQKEYRTLADVVKECLKLQGAGHEVQFDPQHKLWIYRVVIGQEQPVMVSEDNRNVTATEWSSDLLDLCTAGWYQQKQESTEENRETGAIWTFADSEKEEGIYRWDCLLQGETEAEALQDLSQKTKTSKIVAQNADLAWHTDYELGDMVRVQVKKGDLLQTAKKRVIGVHLWYEEGQKGEQPEFESDEEA